MGAGRVRLGSALNVGVAPCLTIEMKLMVLRFNERRATEAAARFLKLRGGRMSYLKLIKIAVLARQGGAAALEQTGDH